MDHQLALNTQAVERYTLGELASPEREEFEEHFFSCPDCAAALREYESFAANARAVFLEDEAAAAKPATAPLEPARPGWWQRLREGFGVRTLVPAGAAAARVLAFVLLRAAPDPAGPTYAWTLAPDVRDEVAHETITRNTVWISPSIDLLVAADQPSRWVTYHWAIQRSVDGKIVAEADGHDGAGQLTLKIAASKFDSGKQYRLTVQGDCCKQSGERQFRDRSQVNRTGGSQEDHAETTISDALFPRLRFGLRRGVH